jgi:hypothetical protein
VSEITERSIRPTLTETIFVWFQRIIAGYCLLFGILYWIRLIGVYDGPLWRFDLMPLHWQVAAVTLAALFPFAAIGLWMLASWGPVIWVICAVIEIAMYLLFPDLYGHRLLIVASHLVVALFYTAFRLLIFWQKRKAEQYS